MVKGVGSGEEGNMVGKGWSNGGTGGYEVRFKVP